MTAARSRDLAHNAPAAALPSVIDQFIADNVRVLIDSVDFGAHPDRDGSRRGVGRVSTSRWPGVHPVAMTDRGL